MNICIPGFILDRGHSGIATYFVQLMEHLQDIDQKNYYELLLSQNEEALVTILNDNFSKKIYSNSIESATLNVFWYNCILPMKAQRQGYDLIHIPCLRRVGMWKNCKVIATAHDLAPIAMPEKYSWPHRYYHRHFLSHTIHRCDHIIAVSRKTKEDIIRYTRYPEDKISVIYPGINRQLYHPVDRQEAARNLKKNYGITSPYIAYISRIEHPGKNHIRLIQAFEMFKKSAPSSHQLVFAGEDWFGASEVREFAKKSPMASEIHFLGFVPLSSIIELYSTCDVMAFPSLYEGFGFPLLEAIACGAKVICSNNSSLAEIGSGNALMFNPYEPTEIFECIQKALADVDPKEQLIQNLRHLETFDWKVTAKQVLKVYDQCA